MTLAPKPRLLVLTPDFPPALGGIQHLVVRLVEHLTGFQAQVVTFDHPDADRVDRATGMDVVRIARSAVPRSSNLLLNAGSLRASLRLRPDLVLSAHAVTSPAAAMMQAAAGIPFAQYVHADEVAQRPRLARFAVGRASATIAVSRYGCRLAIEAGAEPTRVHRIPPGLDFPAERRASRSERPIMITVARLVKRYKGHDVLIRALPRIRAAVPDVTWVVVGDGPLLPELEQLARAHGVADSVVFTGALPDPERDAWLDRAHIFAMPSRMPFGGRGGEGFGIVYLEAAAHSLPVVAGNVAGAPDAVVHGKTGFLVDPTSTASVAEAVVELLLNRDRAERLGRAGAVRALDFAWPRVAARVQELLLSLLDRSETGIPNQPPTPNQSTLPS